MAITETKDSRQKRMFGQWPLILMEIIFLLLLFSSAFCLQNTYISPSNGEFIDLKPFDFYLGFSFVVVLFGLFLFLAKRRFSFRHNLYFILAIIVFIGINIYAALSFPSSFAEIDGYVYKISGEGRLRSIAISIVTSLIAYASFVVFPKTLKNHRYLEWMLYVAMGLAVLAIFYSYFSEAEAYLRLFDRREIVPLKSFMSHKNSYGFLLLLGLISVAILEERKGWKWLYPLAFFLYVNMMVSLSKTAAVLGTFFLIYYIAKKCFGNLKKRPYVLFIVLAILTLAISLFLILGMTNSFQEGSYFQHLFQNVFKKREASTIESRRLIWRNVWQLLFSRDRPYWLYGFGKGNFPYVLGFSDVRMPDNKGGAHNFIMQTLGEEGIIGLVIAILFHGYVVFSLFQIIRKEKGKEDWSSYLAFYLVLLGRFSLENDGLLLGNINSLGASLLFTIPLLTKKEELKEEERPLEKGSEIEEPKNDYRKGLLFLAINLLIGSAVGFFSALPLSISRELFFIVELILSLAYFGVGGYSFFRSNRNLFVLLYLIFYWLLALSLGSLNFLLIHSKDYTTSLLLGLGLPIFAMTLHLFLEEFKVVPFYLSLFPIVIKKNTDKKYN